VLDILYDRDGGRRPEMIVTDTASYSDIVFGLLKLAGFAYAPQLADLPDQKMWRIDHAADYGAFQGPRQGRPRSHRAALGEHPADHRLHPHRRRPRPRRDPDALPRRAPDPARRRDRALRADHQDPAHPAPGRRARLPRQIKVRANLQEGRHALARKIFHGRSGQL
jgi:Tn3 transposase DDE domain